MAVELHENYEWLVRRSKEMSQYSGKWVAIARQQLIATADSMKELLANPAVTKERHPFITQLPLPEEANASLAH